MLAAEATDVQQVIALLLDTGVQVAGWLCAIVIAITWSRRGWKRDPLADVRPAATPFNAEMILVQVATPVVTYLFMRSLLATLVLQDVDAAELTKPGTDAWHRAGMLDASSKLVAVVVMILVLRMSPCFARPAPRLGTGWTVVIGVVGSLAVTSVCLAQLAGLNALWEEWLGKPRAIHPVFIALKEGQWGAWGAASLIFSAVIVAPLAEELFFRGILLQLAWRATDSAWMAVLLSALAFGAIHMSVPPSVLPLCTFGLILGYVRLRYRSLAACVLIHVLFNLRPLLLLLLAPEMAET